MTNLIPNSLEDLNEYKSTFVNGYEFISKEDGLYLVTHKIQDNKQEDNTIRLSDQVIVLGNTIQNNTWGRYLQIRTPDGSLRKVNIGKSILNADSKKAMSILGAIGYTCNQSYRDKALALTYINGVKTEKTFDCINKSGWYKNSFLLKDEIIGNDENIVYLGDEQTNYEIKGDLQQWQENIGKLAVNNSRLVFAISTVLASLLLKPLGLDGISFAFVGQSSKGKTTALNVASSVFGCDIFQGKHTDSGLENLAPAFNDNTFLIDDLQFKTYEDFKSFIYTLANGQSKIKSRLDSNGLDNIKTWKTIVLNTCEYSLQDIAKRENKLINNGQEVRYIGINANIGRFGMFEDLHMENNNLNDNEKGKLFADTIKENSRQYKGVLGREFLKTLIADLDNLIGEVRQNIKSFEALAAEKLQVSDNLVLRVLKYFALSAAAGELATKYNLTSWPKGEAERAAFKCFSDWFLNFGGNDHNKIAFLQTVQSFIGANGARFREEKEVANQLGYKSRKNKNKWYMLVSLFNDEISKGYNKKQCKQWLLDRHWIKPAEQKKLYGSNVYVYTLNVDVILKDTFWDMDN